MATDGPTVMHIEPFALQRLSQWFSANYPLGAYAYSHGLENMIARGVVSDGPSFAAWLSDIVTFGALKTDVILLAEAFRRTDAQELSDLCLALGAGAERQLETSAQGRAFAQVTGTEAHPLPVAIGLAARTEDLPLEATALFYAQSFASNLVTIACRAIPLGATEGQQILRALAPQIDATARAGLAASLDEIGGFAPLGDLASILHETQPVRIFRT